MGPVSWTDWHCKILSVWFGPDLQVEKNWSEVLEKADNLWLQRKLSLKGRADVCVTYIYPLYRFSVVPLPSAYLDMIK